MAVVTPTDSPKSVRNLCVIKVYDGVFCVVYLVFFLISVGIEAFAIGLSQISFFFSP